MEKLVHLEIVQKEFPIFLSAYNDWMIHLARSKKNIREEIAEFYRKMLSKIEGDCLTNNLFFYLNGKEFTYENIIQFDIKDAIKRLDNVKPIPFIDNQIQFSLGENTCKPMISQSCDNALIYVRKIAELAEKTDYPCFYYYQIPITEEQLLEPFINYQEQTYFRIKKQYLPYLRYFDLSKVILKRVDLRGIDLSNTNIKGIELSSLYQNSLENTNLENVILIGQEATNVSIKGANLCGTYLTVNIEYANLEEAIVDDSIILYSNNKGVIPSKFTYVKRKQQTSLHF